MMMQTGTSQRCARGGSVLWRRALGGVLLGGVLLVGAPRPATAQTDEPESPAPAAAPLAAPSTAPATPAAAASSAIPTTQPREAGPTSGPAATQPAGWLANLSVGYATAQVARRPVLVRAGATWCSWCRKLEGELAQPEVKTALARWTLVYIDVDENARDARTLDIAAVPALRVMTPTGRVVAAHQGYLTGAELIAWLDQNYAAANVVPSEELINDRTPDAAMVGRLVGRLEERDSVLREAAIRRLQPYPNLAAAAVASLFTRGPLAPRLAALELLRAWGAPVDGLDPWLPQTLTEARFTAIEDWAATVGARAPATQPAELSAADAAAAQREIAALLKAASPADVLAVRERLARYGPALLAVVYDDLKHAATDEARERLTALRYRLVATDALALSWTGGLERLSANQADTRHQAVDELAKRATAADGRLLLELFSDPDPLVRELSLKALQAVGGADATDALVKLLKDPEPNVRAAVLKQLAESPRGMTAVQIAEYAVGEHDADLVVHAVRVLKQLQGTVATKCLLKLLEHESWRVRAEATEVLGALVSGSSSGSRVVEAQADIYVALIKMLDDPDGFVVSRALTAVAPPDLPDALDPLLRAAEKHPELAGEALTVILKGSAMRLRAVPRLRALLKHERPTLRAAAIVGLCAGDAENVAESLRAAFADPEREVRRAAAIGLFELLEGLRPGERTAPLVSGPHSGDWATRVFVDYTGRNSKPAGIDSDRWLADFRAGKHRPAWTSDFVPLLQDVLHKEEGDARAEAALALIALGIDDEAVPALIEFARSTRGGGVAQAARALPWLPWEKRAALFDALTALRTDAEQLTTLAYALCIWSDDRATARLWDLLNQPDAPDHVVHVVLMALDTQYFGEHTYDPSQAPASARESALKDARARIAAGPEVQRVGALSILASVSLTEGVTAAQQMFADPNSSAGLRRDAFAVLLAAQPAAESEQTAKAALQQPDLTIRRRALLFLTVGGGLPTRLRGGEVWFYVRNPQGYTVSDYTSGGSGQAIVVEAPKGLTLDLLRPLQDDADPETAAAVGYLRVLLGDRGGMDPLLRYWRAQTDGDRAWMRFVYRAITAANDDALVPTLEDIYRELHKDGTWEVRQLYWTIRSMTGPNILKLRKQIRDDVGMDALR